MNLTCQVDLEEFKLSIEERIKEFLNDTVLEDDASNKSSKKELVKAYNQV